jgi:hypothetical protein
MRVWHATWLPAHVVIVTFVCIGNGSSWSKTRGSELRQRQTGNWLVDWHDSGANCLWIVVQSDNIATLKMEISRYALNKFCSWPLLCILREARVSIPGAQILKTLVSQLEKSMRQKGDIKHVPYWEATDIRRRIKKDYSPRDLATGILLTFGLDNQRFIFRIPSGVTEFFLLLNAQTCFGAQSAPYIMVPGALFLVLKRSERGADHPPPSKVVKNEYSHTSTPLYACMTCMGITVHCAV